MRVRAKLERDGEGLMEDVRVRLREGLIEDARVSLGEGEVM